MKNNIDVTPAQRKLILSLIKTHLPNTEVWAYGSRARWSARPESDLDLVAFSTPEQKSNIFALKEAFEESDLPFSVDLFVWDEVPDEFKPNIEKERVVLVTNGQSPLEGKHCTIADLIQWGIIKKPMDGNHGGIHPKQADYVPSGVPFIAASDINNGRISFTSCNFISPDQARQLKKGFTKEGDVLLTHKATIGRTAIVPKNEYPYIVLTPQVTYYRVKDHSKLSSGFLKCYFDSPDFQSTFQSWAGGGSTRAYLSITNQHPLPVVLPPLKTQQAIAHILADRCKNPLSHTP